MTTAYGRPAIELLAAQIVELKDGNPIAPLTVVVRSNHVSVATRRALAARPGGIANVTFVTLRRLAEQLSTTTFAEAGRRPHQSRPRPSAQSFTRILAFFRRSQTTPPPSKR
jgi:hypothetical protein